MSQLGPLSYVISLQQHRSTINFDNQGIESQTLSPGASFWKIETDLKPIYENFNILSYFSPCIGIQIQDIRKLRIKSDLNKAYKFSFNNSSKKYYYLLQLSKDDYKNISDGQGNKKLQILYSVVNQIEWPADNKDEIKLSDIPNSNKILVDFRAIISQNNYQEIIINIRDQDDWILNNLNLVYYQNRQKFSRISEKRSPTRSKNPQHLENLLNQIADLSQPNHRKIQIPKHRTDISYFYIQPQSQRKKVIQNQHVALALQGGGCKGVTYIGAYKALLQNYDKKQITSVIGSSAGGIIGLAVVCRLKPDEIIDICKNYLSKVTNDKKFPNQTILLNQNLKKRYKDIMSIFTEFNILDQQITKLIESYLGNRENVELFYDYLITSTGFIQNDKVEGLFEYDKTLNNKNSPRPINFCGLLNGMLMTGKTIRQIGRVCLQTMFKSGQFKQNVEKLYPGVKSFQNKYYTLTMKQLYDITGIQFTCTSVDITNHILRFFNHKTTPYLPVVNAIQMTGSFPVAFQATYWKKQWGKYYVHYQNVRLQIDLQGCKFTDGGMLANFPIDCIDNQEMRPMYFSHFKDENTVIYGVGLLSCEPQFKRQKNDYTEKLQKMKSRLADLTSLSGLRKNIGVSGIIKSIPSLISSKISLFNFGKGQTKNVQVYNLIKRLTKVPLFDFMINLLITFASTKDKLSQQCFRHQAYDIIPSQKVLDYIKNREEAEEQTLQNIDNLSEIQQQLKQICTNNQNPFEVLKKNLNYIINFQYPKTQQQLLPIYFRLNSLINNLSHNFISIYKQKEGSEQKYFNIINNEISKIYSNKLKGGSGEGLTISQFVIKCNQKKMQLGIIKKQDLQTIKSRKQQYFFDRLFYDLEYIKNSRMFNLCNIEKDYKLLTKIAAQTISILDKVFRNNSLLSPNPLDAKTNKIISVNIPQKYLQFYREYQKNEYQRILDKVKLKKFCLEIPSQLDSIIKMVDDKMNYNTKFMTIFITDTFKMEEIQKVINQMANYQQYKDDLQNLRMSLNKNMKDNNNLQVVKNQLLYLKNKVILIHKNNVGIIKFSQLVNVRECYLTYSIQTLEKAAKFLSKYKRSIQFTIGYDNYEQRSSINSYIKRSIQRKIKQHQKLQGIHIVMQSKPLSQIYFNNVWQILNSLKVQMKSQENQKGYFDMTLKPSTKSQKNQKYNFDMKVSSITTSNIHSIAAIVHASDLNRDKKDYYISQIKNLLYQNQADFTTRISKRLEKGDWAKPTPVYLRELTESIYKEANINNIFTMTEGKMNEIQSQLELEKIIKQIKKNYQIDKERIAEVLQQSLEFVIDQLYKQKRQQGEQLSSKKQNISKMLALNTTQNKYYDQQKNIQPLKNLSNWLYTNYSNIIKSIIQYSQVVAQQFISNVNNKNRKEAWKALILGQLHSSYKVKQLVKQIMSDLQLTRNTTLQQFYFASSKKITLNFTVTNSKTECIQILNHTTRPFMPVWAAVLASSSLIQFFKPFTDRKQWCHKVKQDYEYRKMKNYFQSQKSKYYHLFSADTLRKLPVDLLTNKKIRRKIKKQGEQMEQIFLIFNFDINQDYSNILKSQQIKQHQSSQFQVKNLDLSDLLKIKSISGINLNQIKSIPLLSKKSRQLQLYVNSHDKLIYNLYKQQNVMLPIRLGTLDFHLMVTKDNQLSLQSNDTIMQSYYVMAEKIKNAAQIKKYNNRVCKKFLFFRVQNSQANYLTLRFLTLQIENKGKKQLYKIFYKQNVNGKYRELKRQFLRLKLKQLTQMTPKNQILYLKIEYSQFLHKEGNQFTNFKVGSRCFILDLSKFVKIAYKFAYVYKLYYTQRIKEEIAPEPGFTGKFSQDYIFKMNTDLNQANRYEQIKIPVIYNQQSKNNYWEPPICSNCHILSAPVTDSVSKVFDSFYLTRPYPKYVCLSCQPKEQYKIKQKFTLKLQKDYSIKCALGHNLKMIKGMAKYPNEVTFTTCDLCFKNTPFGRFHDDKCQLDVCYQCAFNSIRNQM